VTAITLRPAASRVYRRARLSPLALWHTSQRPGTLDYGRMKRREEQLTWAKQRALICVGMSRFADAVAGLRADLGKGARPSPRRSGG
jgi:hypothetical protein